MPTSTAWRHRLEYAGFRLAELLARAPPLETASAFSGWLWRMIGPRTRRHRRALDNLALALPETSPAERERIARQMWDMLGRTFAESFRLTEIADGGRVEVEDFDHWRSRGRTPGGWVVCSAHFGNWEAAAAGLREAGRPIAGIYQRLSNPLVEKRLRQMRSRLYPGGLFPKEPASGAQIIRAIRGGAALAILADQRDRRGLMIPFFGVPAPTLAFPALLARKSGAPLLVGTLLRRPGVRFTLRVAEVPVPRTDDLDADVREATTELHRRIEEWIRRDPGQWMWIHRRWG